MQENCFYEKKADDLNYFNFHFAKNNTMKAHFHKNVEMLFVVKGNVKVKINGEEGNLQDHDIAICNGCDVHYYFGDPDSEVYVLVYGNIFKYHIQNDNNEQVFKNFLYHTEGTERIFKLLEMFYQEKNPNFEMKIGFINYLYGLITSTYQECIIKKRSSSNEFSNILLFISQHALEDLQIEDIASRFGYSKNHFSFLFNKYMGMHYRQYINCIRLERVEELMNSNPKMSICDAVLSCGFGSMNTYYRTKENN
jgi:AraC-like DNA-binding protein/quercetin dioxygenase-like cupin family protein